MDSCIGGLANGEDAVYVGQAAMIHLRVQVMMSGRRSLIGLGRHSFFAPPSWKDHLDSLT
jgi:hypothetical protein